MGLQWNPGLKALNLLIMKCSVYTLKLLRPWPIFYYLSRGVPADMTCGKRTQQNVEML